jgi:hypothetical protein
MARSRRRSIFNGLAAIFILLALGIGVPVALYRLGGSPIPSHFPAPHRIYDAIADRNSAAIVLDAVRDITWIFWLLFALSVAVEIQAIASRRAPRIRLVPPEFGNLIHELVASAMVLSAASASVSLALPPSAVVWSVGSFTGTTRSQDDPARSVSLDVKFNDPGHPQSNEKRTVRVRVLQANERHAPPPAGKIYDLLDMAAVPSGIVAAAMWDGMKEFIKRGYEKLGDSGEEGPAGEPPRAAGVVVEITSEVKRAYIPYDPENLSEMVANIARALENIGVSQASADSVPAHIDDPAKKALPVWQPPI